ncbi:MAG: ketoacyl-ACP synthase III [Polyangiaceae bacterium]|nr:ketoacyl-ACP synthase III [Polyangiaceae bacterium]
MRRALPFACKIAATGSYLPARIVPNRDLEAFLDTSDAWIRERTGIGARHVAADDEVTSDLAAQAARRALERAGIDVGGVDMIIVATVTPDGPMPACAVRVQHKLGATTIPAFDVSAACAGFLFGVTIADQFICSGAMQRVLVVGVELLSRIIDWSDRTTAVLFGDGAGAVVLERAPADSEQRIELCRIHSEGALADALSIPAGGSAEPVTERALHMRRNKVQMVGQEVFRAAVRGIADVGAEVVADAGLTMADIDRFVPHQANVRILSAVAERWGVPLDRFVLVLEETGNTSSASIPIALDRGLRDGRIASGERVLMCALGAGVSYGAVLARV